MKRAWLLSLIAVVLLIALPPFVMHTSVYPIAVVKGNSMYPVLKNGELVFFTGSINRYDIPNGTIIVFVEPGTSFPVLAQLSGQVVIHVVINRVVNQYGKVYYQTKGVNNLYPDPNLVPAQNVLGAYVYGIPYAGFVFMFLTSPGGLVFLVGVVAILYVSSVEASFIKQRQRIAMVSELLKYREQGLIDEARLAEAERAVLYADSYEPTDEELKKLARLSRKGRLDGARVLSESGSVFVEAGGLRVEVSRPRPRRTLSEVVRDALVSYGGEVPFKALVRRLEKKGMSLDEALDRPKEFLEVLNEIYGGFSRGAEERVSRAIAQSYGLPYSGEGLTALSETFRRSLA